MTVIPTILCLPRAGLTRLTGRGEWAGQTAAEGCCVGECAGGDSLCERNDGWNVSERVTEKRGSGGMSGQEKEAGVCSGRLPDQHPLA